MSHSVKAPKTTQKRILYDRLMCGWCQEAKAWLDQRGWKYNSLNTGTEAAAR